MEVREKPLKQGILTLTQQSDALCMDRCDIATHRLLFGLIVGIHKGSCVEIFMWNVMHSACTHCCLKVYCILIAIIIGQSIMLA